MHKSLANRNRTMIEINYEDLEPNQETWGYDPKRWNIWLSFSQLSYAKAYQQAIINNQNLAKFMAENSEKILESIPIDLQEEISRLLTFIKTGHTFGK